MTSTDPQRDHERTTGRFRRWLPLAIVLAIGTYAVAFVVVGGDEAWELLTQASWRALLGAAALQVVVTLTWPLVYRASVRALGRDIRYRDALTVSMSAYCASQIVPGGGGVGAAVAVERLTRLGLPGPVATSSVALTHPVSFAAIAGFGAIGIGAAVVAGDLPDAAVGVAILAVAILLGLVAGVIASLRSPSFGDRLISLIARLHRRLAPRAEDWRRTWRSITGEAPTARDMLPVILWATVKSAVNIAALALIFVAAGQTPRPAIVLAGFAVAHLVASIPSTPGGIGIVEGGMVALFAAFGMSTGPALLIAILHRGLEIWLPTVAAIPVLLQDVRRPDA